MIIDFWFTAHMRPLLETVDDKKNGNPTIALGDDSALTETEKGLRKVCWQRPSDRADVSLTDTRIARYAAMSLLSLPALRSKAISAPTEAQEIIISNLKTSPSVLKMNKRSQKVSNRSKQNQKRSQLSFNQPTQTLKKKMNHAKMILRVPIRTALHQDTYPNKVKCFISD